jgi:exodeoxyribonuclease VII small subunit
MESDIPLKKSLELYKEGMEELGKAQKILEEAKLEIEVIQKEQRCE